MRAFGVILTLCLASGPAVYAADPAAFGYEEFADDVTGARMWLPPGYTTEVKEGAETAIPKRVSPEINWEEGELAGLGVRVFGVVLMPENGGKAEQLADVFERTYDLENLVPPEERELAPERLAQFGPLALEGRVSRYEYDTAAGTPSASIVYYVNAGVYVYAFVLKWPRANAAAAEAAERISPTFSLEPPGEAAPPPPPTP